MRPERLWWLSCQLYRKNLVLPAKLLKACIYMLYHAVLPYQAEIEPDIVLEHYALGIVVHPNVTLGHRVRIYQHVTLAAQTWIGSEHRIVVEDDVTIGAGAVLLPASDTGMRVGKGAQIAPCCLVQSDVPAGCTVQGAPARPVAFSGTQADVPESETAKQLLKEAT